MTTLAPPASAQPPPQEAPPPTDASKAATEVAESPKRNAPDYDGRKEPTTAGDVLIWIPRVIFFPAYIATEYVVRKPLGFLTVAAENGRWVQKITEFFTFGPRNDTGLVPTGLIDFGFQPSFGLYFFHDSIGPPANSFRIHAATGGDDWYRLTVADRLAVDDRSYVKLRAEGWVRPDWLFAGIGPESLDKNRSRYLAKSLEGGFSFYGGFKSASSIELYTDVKRVAFGDGTCCDDPTLRTRVAEGAFEIPPGFETGYMANRLGFRLGLDSRRPRPEPGSGVRLDVRGEHAFDMLDARSRWIRYGGTLGGFLDVTGHNRVLSLSVTALFADPIDDKEVPFTELVELGGEGPMKGFLQGRLRGRSAAVATLEYRYPIWAFLDGSIQAAVGNVFNDHLSGFDPELLRFSFNAGLRTIGSRDHSFDILIGSGTETFRQGAALHEVRFLIGATRGF